MKRKLFGIKKLRNSPVYYYLVEETRGTGYTYGVEVRYREETELIRDITTIYEDILRLLNLLRRGLVTPTTLRDVVEDWLVL